MSGLPGTPHHPAPATELEGLTQIIRLLLMMNNNLGSVTTELRNMTAALQHISQRIPR